MTLCVYLRSRLLLQPVSYSQLARSIHELAATSDQVSVVTFSEIPVRINLASLSALIEEVN